MPQSKKRFSIQQSGIDYFIVLLQHIDRMGDSLREGLDVGKVGTKTLVGYYELIIHLEGLLVPFLTKEFYDKRKEYEKNLPGYDKTWSGDLRDQVKYFLAISDLFQLLILVAYKQGVLKIKRVPEWRGNQEIL